MASVISEVFERRRRLVVLDVLTREVILSSSWAEASERRELATGGQATVGRERRNKLFEGLDMVGIFFQKTLLIFICRGHRRRPSFALSPSRSNRVARNYERCSPRSLSPSSRVPLPLSTRPSISPHFLVISLRGLCSIRLLIYFPLCRRCTPCCL